MHGRRKGGKEEWMKEGLDEKIEREMKEEMEVGC